jgi:fatty-acyl-CoA synthase
MNSNTPADFSFELTPTTFLRARRACLRRRVSVDGDRRFTYADFQRCQVAGALEAMGVAPGDRVAILAGNSHVMLAAHYAVRSPARAGRPQHPHHAGRAAYILEHSGSSPDLRFNLPAAEQAAR